MLLAVWWLVAQDGRTALLVAADEHDRAAAFDMTKRLLAHGADVNAGTDV